jgi:ABC-2 type transport system permease protein
MTTTLISAPRVSRGHLRTSSLLRSEWTKLRSVRSTMWTLVTMTVVTIGIGLIASVATSNNWKTMAPFDKLTFDPTGTSLRGLLFSQLIIGVLGALVMSAEYGTGTIRASLAAVPNRPRVLATKAAVFAAVSLVVGEVLSFCAFFIGQALLASPAPHATLSQPGVLRAVVGGGLVLMVLGLFAMGLATIIRHSAGAITAYIGTILVVPVMIQALPASIGNAVSKFMAFKITNVLTSVQPSTDTAHSFSPWVGFAVLCGYAVVALGIGGWLMVRRDA